MQPNPHIRARFSKCVGVILCLTLMPVTLLANCQALSSRDPNQSSVGTEESTKSFDAPESKPLYIKVRFNSSLKLSKLKPGSIIDGTLADAVYSGDREIFPAGSIIGLTVDRLERVRRPPNDHWPWVIKAFSPRHERRPVFSSASVLVVDKVADDRKVPLRVSLISMSEKKDVRVHWKTEKAHLASQESGSPVGGLALNSKDHAGITATFEAVELTGSERAFTAAQPDPHPLSTTEPDSLSSAGTVAAGTEARIILLSAVDASANRRGDRVVARVVEPVRSGRRVLIPEGSLFEGRVQKVTRPKWLSRSGSLLMTFDRLAMPGGSVVPVIASIAGAELDESSHTRIDPEGNLNGDRPGRAWMLINFGAAAGLAKVADDTTQLVIEAIVSTATDVSTAGIARIVGTCVSGIFMITRRGRNVILPKYTELRIVLDEPVSLPTLR